MENTTGIRRCSSLFIDPDQKAFCSDRQEEIRQTVVEKSIDEQQHPNLKLEQKSPMDMQK